MPERKDDFLTGEDGPSWCLKEHVDQYADILQEFVGAEMFNKFEPGEYMVEMECDFKDLGCPAIAEFYCRFRDKKLQELSKVDKVDFKNCWKDNR